MCVSGEGGWGGALNVGMKEQAYIGFRSHTYHRLTKTTWGSFIHIIKIRVVNTLVVNIGNKYRVI